MMTAKSDVVRPSENDFQAAEIADEINGVLAGRSMGAGIKAIAIVLGEIAAVGTLDVSELMEAVGDYAGRQKEFHLQLKTPQ